MVTNFVFSVTEAGKSIAHGITEYEGRHIPSGIELLYQLDTEKGLDPRSRSLEGSTVT